MSDMPISSKKIAVIGDKNPSSLVAEAEACIHYLSAQSLAVTDEFFFILLNVSGEAALIREIEYLRTTEQYALLPIFSEITLQSPTLHVLLDGCELSYEAMRHKALDIYQKLDALPLDKHHSDAEYRLLAYLYARPDCILTFTMNPHQATLIDYPLARIMLGDASISLDRIFSLADQDFLEKHLLCNEIQLCPFCESGFVNFKNTCIHCQSIDIKRESFLHCFSCGHTAPEDIFLKKEGLICPKCHARLRHFGIDYDRPLEDYVCKQCQHTFLTPDIVVYCLECQKGSAPEALLSRKLYQYKLSTKGARHIRLQPDVYHHLILDAFHYIDLIYFKFITDWGLDMVKRYGSYFSVACLSIDNHDAFIESVGNVRARQILDEVFKLLRAKLRSTDFLARVDDEIIVILLPIFAAESAPILYSSIEKYLAEIKNVSSTELDIRFECICTQDIDVNAYDAGLLIGELVSRIRETS